MFLPRLLARLLRPARRPVAPPAARLRVERLEDRNAPNNLTNLFLLDLDLLAGGRSGGRSGGTAPRPPQTPTQSPGTEVTSPTTGGNTGTGGGTGSTGGTGGTTGGGTTGGGTTGGGTTGGGTVGGGTTGGGTTGGGTGGTGGGTGGGGSGDTTGPSAPTGFSSRFNVTTDTGASATDRITRDNRPLVSGTARPGSRVSVFVDGVRRATVPVARNGKWKATMPRLTDGQHTIRASSGGQTPWIVDTKAPTVRLEAPEFSTTTTPTVTLTITQNDKVSTGGEAAIDVDRNDDGDFADRDELNFATQTLFADNATLTLPELPEGTYRVRARVTDLAGNVGASPVSPMQIDPNAGKVGQLQLLKLIDAYGRFGDQTLELFEDTAVYDPAGTGGPAAEQVLAAPMSLYSTDGEGRVLVSVRATLAKHTNQLETDLKTKLGMEVVNKTTANQQNMVTGWLKVSELRNLASLDNFNTANLTPKPITRVGSVTSQGDAVMKTDDFRSLTGKTGNGVRIGILSDSINRVAGGISDSSATGDLGAVTVLLDGPANGSDEGRGMAELVHDVAPGSPLLFRTAFLGAQDFAQGIRDLQTAGSKVITDDVGYANSPFFNDGVISKAVNDVFNRGAVYTSAAGNSGNEGFRARWQSTTATLDGITGTFFTFGGGDILQDMAGGGTFTLNVQWDDSFLENGSAAANYQVTTDIAVHVVDPTGNIAFTVDDVNATTDEAFEFVGVTAGAPFSLAYQLMSGPAPTRIAWTNFGGQDPGAQGQGAATTFGQPTAAGAIGTGAFNSLTGTLEPFTAEGGNLEFMFDANGARLGTPEIRRKPDLTGPDGANTTFFGADDPGDADTFPNFFGTSAAAPHVAAAAALLLSDEPRATNLDVFAHLQLTALDVGTPGFDEDSGSGLVQLEPIQLDPIPTITDQNETSDQASNLGVIRLSQSLSGQSISKISGWAEYDWYQFTTVGTRLQIRALATTGGPLEIHVFRRDGALLTRLGTDTLGPTPANLIIPTVPGVTYYVEVKGKNTAPGVITTGNYDLSIRRMV